MNLQILIVTSGQTTAAAEKVFPEDGDGRIWYGRGWARKGERERVGDWRVGKCEKRATTPF